MRRDLGTCAAIALLAWTYTAQAACALPVRDGPIVSIGGDVTEIVYALGAGARVASSGTPFAEDSSAQAVPVHRRTATRSTLPPPTF